MTLRAAVTRRAVLAIVGLAALIVVLPGAAPATAADTRTPIVFVHGNGDSAAEWMVTMWRWESNGYPRDLLFAVNLRNPTANPLADEPSPGTSTTEAAERQLSDYVAGVLERTDARKVAFIGNSRGANIIRNFVKLGGGDKVTSHVVLGGGVNHGAFDIPGLLPTAEFNGASAFMQSLNTPSEVVAGVDFLTIRSDFFDKYAQPDGRFIVGFPGIPTNISYDAPELKGAKNLVFRGIDHRETATSRAAFEAAFQFITGDEPRRHLIVEERRPRLSGIVTGVTAGLYDNIPEKGADLKIFKIDRRSGTRIGAAVYRETTDEDGRWGPFVADADTYYEFLLKVPGKPATHIYRQPFLRGSKFVHLRPAMNVKDPDEGSVVVLSRPAGYFGVEDTLLFDGARPAFSTDKVPNVVAVTVRTPFRKTSHLARFGDETLGLRNWPKGHVAIAEFND